MQAMMNESVRGETPNSAFPSLAFKAGIVVVIFVCAFRIGCTLHMLENTLRQVVSEQLIEWPESPILDVV
jgi:hypothetical protein